jgi:hypothetical protein
MNNLYFACIDCKVYVDAGYGWAYWSLEEPGVVRRGRPVSVESVLSAKEYWTPSRTESADWLYEKVLPSVRYFLERHTDHTVIYGCIADFLPFDGEGFLDWLQLGFMPQLLPRYFVEYLGLKTWDEVRNFIADQESEPWWWMLEWDDLHDKARKKFQELIKSAAVDRQVCCARSCANSTKSM